MWIPQPLRRLRFGGEDGSSVTEMAIMAPILVVMVLWLIYFWEMQEARIKAAEAARFVAFERTAMRAPAAIADDAKRRFQNLDSTTRNVQQSAVWWNRLTIEKIEAAEREAPLATRSVNDTASAGGVGGSLGQAVSLIGDSVGKLIGLIGFDTGVGAVESTVVFKMENKLIPRRVATYLSAYGSRSDFDLRFTDRMFLYYDPWRAWKQGNEPAKTYEQVEANTVSRVQGIAYLGLANAPGVGGALSEIGKLLGTLGLEFPLDPGYVARSTRIRDPRVQAPDSYAAVTPTRTAPGDVYWAAYWTSDSKACFDSCEPAKVKDIRRRENRHYRSYNCRGDFFQGTIKSGISEYDYVMDSRRGGSLARQVFRFGSEACE